MKRIKRKITPEQRRKRLELQLMNQDGEIYIDEGIILAQPPEYLDALIIGF